MFSILVIGQGLRLALTGIAIGGVVAASPRAFAVELLESALRSRRQRIQPLGRCFDLVGCGRGIGVLRPARRAAFLRFLRTAR